MKLHHKTILITGGTSGIGLEMATQLRERENTVLVTGRDEARLAALARTLGVHGYRSDVTSDQDIVALHNIISTRHGGLDVLVNNAGIMRNIDLRAGPAFAELDREIDINLRGPIAMVQHFLPQLLHQNEAAIVNVSSGLAFVPLSIAPIYSASKAALHAYTIALRMQLADSSVSVIELAPPPVETPLLRGEFEREMEGQTAMSPKVLVRKAIEAIEKGHAEIRPGLSNALKVMSRLAPTFMTRQLARMMAPK